MKKRYLILLLVLSMLLSLIPAASAEGPAELHFITRRRGNAYEENQVKQIIEEKFNVKIKWEILPSEGYGEACSVILSSGDYPDMMEWQASSSTIQAEVPLLAEDGVLAPLNELLETYGQDILAEREEDKWLWVDGERYSIPCRPGNVTETFLTIRQDWLDALNLTMPTTLDEFSEVCRAFTFDDPDGDGVDDTYALGGALNGGYGDTLTVVLGFFGVTKDWTLHEDGTYLPWQLTDNALAAMKYLRELYEMGVVDPEFISDTRDRYLEKKSLDHFGIEQWYLTQTGSTSAWWNTFTANVPHQNTVTLPLFAADGYEAIWPNLTASPSGVALGGFQLLIFEESEHKDVIMQIIDFLATQEGSELVTFGPKGVTWDEDENGNYYDIECDEETINQSGRELYYVVYWHDIYKRNADPLVLDGFEKYTPYVRPAADFPYVYEGDTSALNGLLDTHIIKILTDLTVDPDVEFEVMTQEYNAMGGEDYIRWYNEKINQ
ncbi:MAG: extracellular solute-binding protein [Eubacteriales bacterium]|nr:extracellular solute-binding protein [Eubacteriales bacterium]